MERRGTATEAAVVGRGLTSEQMRAHLDSRFWTAALGQPLWDSRFGTAALGKPLVATTDAESRGLPAALRASDSAVVVATVRIALTASGILVGTDWGKLPP